MSITRNIMIDGREVSFRASAAIPRIYRLKFRRDIYRDMAMLAEAVSGNDPEDSGLGIQSLEVFEDIAYIMAKHADPSVPDDPLDWLDGFGTFSIYRVLPRLLELWGLNTETQVESKKK